MKTCFLLRAIDFIGSHKQNIFLWVNGNSSIDVDPAGFWGWVDEEMHGDGGGPRGANNSGCTLIFAP